MARISEMHKKWMKQPKYRKAYEALHDEYVKAADSVDKNCSGAAGEETRNTRTGVERNTRAGAERTSAQNERRRRGRTYPALRELQRWVGGQRNESPVGTAEIQLE